MSHSHLCCISYSAYPTDLLPRVWLVGDLQVGHVLLDCPDQLLGAEAHGRHIVGSRTELRFGGHHDFPERAVGSESQVRGRRPLTAETRAWKSRFVVYFLMMKQQLTNKCVNERATKSKKI